MSEGENTQTAHLVFDLGEKKKKKTQTKTGGLHATSYSVQLKSSIL